jgi:betaine reductase
MQELVRRNRVGIEGVSYSLAHVPDLVRFGSKPLRELRAQLALGAELVKHLRDVSAATAYAPHEFYIGNIAPEKLRDLPLP